MDSIPDYFQELKFLRRLISVCHASASDSDGEQGESIGNYCVVGTRSSGPSCCRHAVPA
jgi:hypothetical protein